MRALKLILLCSSALLVLSDLVPAPPQQGPCRPLRTIFPIPPQCEPSCVFVCIDPCKRYIYADGFCLQFTGPCTEVDVTVDGRRCRDCSCPLGGGACQQLGFYNVGTRTVVDC
jgi:hypothetical protein